MTPNVANSTSNSVADMIAKVMDKFDTNKDKSLSAEEFTSFLSGLVNGNVLSPANRPAAAARASFGEYRSWLSGFDHFKIDNPDTHGAGTSKYIAARIFQHYKPMPESLPAIVGELRAQGINATQVSFDKIDFGDGYGPIDVIESARAGGGVAWQWLPQ